MESRIPGRPVKNLATIPALPLPLNQQNLRRINIFTKEPTKELLLICGNSEILQGYAVHIFNYSIVQGENLNGECRKLRNVHKILVGKLEGKRGLGKTRRSSMINIKIVLAVQNM
jgi:hypothetical protein